MRHTTICIASLLGGMIIGSALAMLLTPQSGPELRRKIKDKVEDEVDQLKTKAEQLQAKLKAEIDDARCHCNDQAVKA